MRVTSVEPVLCSHEYPEGERLEWSAGRIESWDAALIRVETADGLVGWGEVGQGMTAARAVPGVVEEVAGGVVGRDPSNVGEIRVDLYDRNVFWARGGLPTGTIGAIEVALYDILGKATGQPVYRLLGGRAGEVRAYGSGGIAADASGRVDQARTYAERGFHTVKIRAVADPMANIDLVERALDVLDGDIRLALDAVQGSAGDPWSVPEAIRLGEALEAYADRLAWYEEPCRAENLDGYRRVQEATTVPVAGIETRVGRYEFRDVVEAGAVDILQPDVAIAGGFAATREASAVAASHDIPVVLHVWGTGVSLLANAHYAAADPNCELIEHCQLPNPLREALLPDAFGCDDGVVALPDDPGLGLDVPDDIEERFAFVPGKGHVFD